MMYRNVKINPWLLAVGMPVRLVAGLAYTLFYPIAFILIASIDPRKLPSMNREFGETWRWVFTAE